MANKDLLEFEELNSILSTDFQYSHDYNNNLVRDLSQNILRQFRMLQDKDHDIYNYDRLYYEDSQYSLYIQVYNQRKGLQSNQECKYKKQLRSFLYNLYSCHMVLDCKGS